MGAVGYESWFISARDPVSRRALWIRHMPVRRRFVDDIETAGTAARLFAERA
jgi:hypothetical protein